MGNSGKKSRAEVAKSFRQFWDLYPRSELRILWNSKAFRQFWDLYPRKVGKAAARQAWSRIFEQYKPADKAAATRLLQQILDRLYEAEIWTVEEIRYIPHPSTWLRREEWTND